MAKIHNKKIKTLFVIGSLLIITIGSLYWGRNGLLRHEVNKQALKVEQKYGLSISYNLLKMNGLDEVILQGLSIVPHHHDTLLTLQSVDVQLNFWKLLSGHIEVRNVKVDGLQLSFIKKDSIANYDFLFYKETSPSIEKQNEVDFSKRANETLNLLFGFLPENGELSQLHITEQKDSSFVAIHIPTLHIRDNQFRTEIEIHEDSLMQLWNTSGELNRDANTLKAELYGSNGRKVSFPYITHSFGAEVTFDTLSYSLTKEERSHDEITLSGEAEISGLTVYQKALSPERINLDRGEFDYRINLTPSSIEMDSATIVQFNRLKFHPYLRLKKKEQEWHITASVNKPWFPADELFGSLPQGLFNNLEGIQTSGNLAYHFLLDVDFALLDSLKFESELKEKDFHIKKYGAGDLEKMSKEFSYTAYEEGKPVRTFSIGPSWEHFTPLDSISPLLQMSVMQSEDGAFYYHQGFLPKAMREALIHDLKVKRFARGGSTITMQLVKNVFLNRNKNIARKLEEALIVWLIETQKLTPKERMYEVYLNIAEWGPLIYGIHEASDYYFNKLPSQLTAEESIFLASIIPKPKHFRNSFTDDLKLRESMGGYYRLIAERLVKKGLISEEEAEQIRPEIEVTGEARRDFFLSKDSMDIVLQKRIEIR